MTFSGVYYNAATGVGNWESRPFSSTLDVMLRGPEEEGVILEVQDRVVGKRVDVKGILLLEGIAAAETVILANVISKKGINAGGDIEAEDVVAPSLSCAGKITFNNCNISGEDALVMGDGYIFMNKSRAGRVVSNKSSLHILASTVQRFIEAKGTIRLESSKCVGSMMASRIEVLQGEMLPSTFDKKNPPLVKCETLVLSDAVMNEHVYVRVKRGVEKIKNSTLLGTLRIEGGANELPIESSTIEKIEIVHPVLPSQEEQEQKAQALREQNKRIGEIVWLLPPERPPSRPLSALSPSMWELKYKVDRELLMSERDKGRGSVSPPHFTSTPASPLKNVQFSLLPQNDPEEEEKS